MADAQTYIKDPNEKWKDFNLRLLAACHEFDTTDYQLACINGEPMVTLLAGMVPATEEDVEDAEEEKKLDKDVEVPELGEPIPEGDIICVQVCEVSAIKPTEANNEGLITAEGDALKSEKRLETLYVRANGGLTKHISVSGRALRLVDVPGNKDKQLMEVPINLVAIGYVESDPESAK